METQEILANHSERITRVEMRVDTHTRHLEKLDKAIADLRATVATKDDIGRVEHLLGDALIEAIRTTPPETTRQYAYTNMMWSAVIGICAICTLVYMLATHGR